jgi:hypothetical protein
MTGYLYHMFTRIALWCNENTGHHFVDGLLFVHQPSMVQSMAGSRGEVSAPEYRRSYL